jgi:hypothetical protein
MTQKDVQQIAQSRRAEEWLAHLKAAARDTSHGRLKIFLGMCAGVGKPNGHSDAKSLLAW